MTETCDPIATNVVDLIPESACPDCEQPASGCTCTIIDILWTGAISDCMAELGFYKNISLQAIVTIFSNALCDESDEFDCSDIAIDGDYDNIGFDGTQTSNIYNLASANFTGSPVFYITVDGRQISLGSQTTITTVATAIDALGITASVGVLVNVITVVGFHDFGNIGYSDITFSPTVSETEVIGTLCDLLDALDYSLSRVGATPYGFDPFCFDTADNYFDYISGIAEQLCEDLYTTPLFLELAGNSIDNPILADLFTTAGFGLRFYDAGYTTPPNITSFGSATAGGIGLSIFGGLVNNGDADILPVSFSSPVRQQRYKIYDIQIPVVNTTFTPSTLPYQVFVDKTVITNFNLPTSTAFPPGVTNVCVRFTATVFTTTAAGICTITPGGADTIQGGATFNFAPSTVNWVELILDGSNWRIAAKG